MNDKASSEATQATVFVVDDDDAVRESIQFLLKSAGYGAVAFASAQAFLEQYDPNTPGCLILDIRMPGMTGLELQQKLNEQQSIMPIIFITGHGDVPMAVQALKAGASDFIQKPFQDDELLGRVKEVLALDAEIRSDAQARSEIQAHLDSLTQREQQVMEQVVDGKANKMIAYNLSVSQRTVEIHRANVMEKMKAKSLAHLVRLVMKARGEIYTEDA